MGHLRPVHVLFLLILVRTLVVHAQDVTRPAEYAPLLADSAFRQNTASIVFDRNLNTYNWIERVALDTSAGRMTFFLNHQFSANIIRLDQTGPAAVKRLESNQHTFILKIGDHLSSVVQPRLQWSSLIYSDNKGTELNNAFNHSFLAGVELAPYPFVSISPMGGFRWDDQSGIRDRGPAFQLGTTVRPIDIDGYALDGSAQYYRAMLDPRTLENGLAWAGVEKYFSPLTRDSVQIGLGRNRREFYTLTDNSIESRVENTFTFSNLLDYAVDQNILTSVFVNVNGRSLDKDNRPFGLPTPGPALFGTHINELHLEASLQGSYRSDDGRTGGSVRLTHIERNEAHTAKLPDNPSPGTVIQFLERNREEQSKDNLSRRSAVAGMFSFPFSASDIVNISGTAGILRYDTPSDLNVEDRDELLLALTISTRHHISRALDLGLLIEGSKSHLVYLLKERSANNNRNYVLRFSPRTVFSPAAFLTTLNIFEVLANYTVYDFEEQTALVRSFSYRQFAWLDSSAVELTHRIGVDFFAYWKLYERGQLKWDEFTERTENSSVDKTLALQVRFRPSGGTTFALGLRYFSQSRYQYDSTIRHLAEYLRSVGPTCLIIWEISPHSQFSLNGWVEQKRQTEGGAAPSLASMTMNLRVIF